ncbi:hypothetical protein GOP47_0024158 [Adiantum capillus-veneris]|uniref:BTB domain-containing protein n=1 Tax=Adiantum capillus-veneris TaxID=13818 RepID=A0A9D4U618_ADICA|nr:hypothetical protein GOP47_0024158 [Adiantum capillus-veneris]
MSGCALGYDQPPCKKLRLEAEEGGETLLIRRLGGMLNNPLLSDLCLLCKDGVKVHACRMLLMASSDVFRQMLSNGMAESSMFNSRLPEISSSALLPTLEYLYTGAITQHEMDLGTAFGVFHVATFFNLPTLEARIKLLFPILIADGSEYPAILAQHLSTLEAYGLTHLLDDVVGGIELCLRCHCCAAHPSTFLRHLSTQGMLSLADFLRSKNEHATVFSFMEYICVRSLLIWGASHISREAVDFFEKKPKQVDCYQQKRSSMQRMYRSS